MSSTPRRPYAPRLPPDQRREQLLDAALEIISVSGVSGVSMEAVARRVEVTKPVVYGIFADRGELLTALLEREEQRALAQLAAAIPSVVGEGLDPDTLLAEGFGVFLAAVAEHPQRWRMILAPSEGIPPLVIEHVAAAKRSIVAQLEGLIHWGVTARGGPTVLDQEIVAHAIVSLGETAARLVLEDPERWPPERFRTFAERIIAMLPKE